MNERLLAVQEVLGYEGGMTGLIKFRWIAMVVMMFGFVPLWQWGYLQKKNFPYYMGVLALLAVFNAFSQGTQNDNQILSKQKDLLIHLWVDLLAVVGLLFVSGSASNPFVHVLCIHAFLGGMLLRGARSFLFACSVMGLLLLLQVETYLDSRVIVGMNSQELFLGFLSQWVTIFASWFVSQYFSQVIHKNEMHIRNLQLRQQQADRLKALGALTAGFSHEMATPMNALSLRMDRGLRKLQEGDLASVQEFEKAQGSLKECVRIFRDMATIFSHSSQSELQSVNLPSLLENLIRSWRAEHPGREVEIHFMSEEVRARLQVLSFSKTIFDLLDNAHEATQSDRPIGVRLYRKGSHVILEVLDEGKGLSEEILSRIGEPFVTNKDQGNGLGLYAALMMAQAVGGEFKISNNTSGVGAIAQISLPLEEV